MVLVEKAVHSSGARLLPERAGASTVLPICSWLGVRSAMGTHLLNRDETGCSCLLQQQLNQKSVNLWNGFLKICKYSWVWQGPVRCVSLAA